MPMKQSMHKYINLIIKVFPSVTLFASLVWVLSIQNLKKKLYFYFYNNNIILYILLLQTAFSFYFVVCHEVSSQ